MKKVVLALVALLFVGCPQPQKREVVVEQAAVQDERFELTNRNAFSGAQRNVQIILIKDKETNVEYLVVVHYQGIAICPVVKNEK